MQRFSPPAYVAAPAPAISSFGLSLPAAPLCRRMHDIDISLLRGFSDYY